MAKFVSRRCEIGIAKEAVRGTAVNPTFWIPWASVSFDNKVEMARETSAYGNIADSDSKYITGKFGEGKIEGEIRDYALGLFLENVMGQNPVTTGSAPYTHTYTLAQTNQHQSLSILIQDPNGATMFPLAMITELKIKIEPKGIVQYTIDFVSRGGIDWGRQTSVYTEMGNKFLHQHLGFSVAATIGALPGTQIDVKSLEFSFTKNVMIDWVDGTVQPADLMNQSMGFEGKLELSYEDRVWRNYMLDGTYKSAEIKLVNGTNAWTMRFPRIDFFDWEPNLDLNAIATQKLAFKANYDAANALQLISTCTLANAYNAANY